MELFTNQPQSAPHKLRGGCTSRDGWLHSDTCDLRVRTFQQRSTRLQVRCVVPSSAENVEQTSCTVMLAMYETEANLIRASLRLLPFEASTAFAQGKSRILRRTLLPWSEHCTECVWPTCYTTCDLYSPRPDGRCRRFVDGMVRIDFPESTNGYLLQIRFKQWGKLWTPGNLNLHTVAEAERAERRDLRIGTLLQTVPLPNPMRRFAIRKRYSLKKHLVHRVADSTQCRPTSFQLECFNPSPHAVRLSITFRAVDKNSPVPFQKLAILQPGFQIVRIPFEEITQHINLHRPFQAELVPNDVEDELTLYFGMMDFIQEKEERQEKPARVESSSARKGSTKCVVWDLDHTVWDGVLVEDGAAALKLKPHILELMSTLDAHGILQSVVSKNDHDQAMQVLREFKLNQFFLYPQISWSPKGEGIQAIVRELNLSPKHVLFVDDSAFEREQVAASYPDIRTLDASDYLSLGNLPECRSATTSEGLRRRELYEVESNRKQLAASFQDDYKAFLKSCQIHLTISALSLDNLERVHELTQRTNQMNFSGTRYDRERLRAVLEAPQLDTYVLACEDRFGSYGIVGFGLVDTSVPVLTDLMFSCRIQTKRVEHAFLAYIITRYQRPNQCGFSARYRKTPRNEPSGRVFADLGMEETAVVDETTLLFFPYKREIPKDGLITITTTLASFPWENPA